MGYLAFPLRHNLRQPHTFWGEAILYIILHSQTLSITVSVFVLLLLL
jgi:hypothetical protein